MSEGSPVILLLIVITIYISYKGFKNRAFMQHYGFDVDKVLTHKEYIRILSSGFLHVGWVHLIFNMIALYSFGSMLEPMLGWLPVLVIYFLALIGGSLLALFIHKNNSTYTSVGASGAVNGIIYASIALAPHMGIGLFILPITIPAWAFGLAYVIFSIYGVKAKWGNSGHEAHLGGALTGMLTAIAMYPGAFSINYLPILAIVLPTIAFLLLIVYKPEILFMDAFSKKGRPYTIDHEYNYKKAQQQMDIDNILEKIHKKGLNSLTKREKEALEQYSKMRK
ncbi:MAG TPA: rhomboid family intramembrane serine protease [Flavisolibacter sp.]|nr:rhomboid family intramembrane serine protease [Flavisolibacter sp.]